MTNQQTVVTGLPGGGSHATRTLEFGENDNWLYISIGSAGNIDADSSRSRIVRVDISRTLPIAYSTAEVFADGCRNEVGLRMDPFNRLWGVENGLDNLPRFKPQNDYTETNPAEEVNIFTQENAGKHYGYPYCWSEGIGEGGANTSFPGGLGNGTLWATQNPTETSNITDAWCREKTLPAKWSMQAHTAPLDIRFDNTSEIVPSPGVAALITLHGSWNRDVTAGARVDYLTLDAEYNPTKLTNLAQFPTTTWSTRPVAIARSKCRSHGSCLFVTDDHGGKIFVIARIQGPAAPTAPASTPTAPPPQSPNIIEVGEDLTIHWEITEDGESLWTNVSYTDSRGWIGFAWNENGAMSGTSALLVLDATFGGAGQAGASNISEYIGFASLDDRSASSILGSWNNPSYDWGYTNFSAARNDDHQWVAFTRPLKCASGGPSGCYSIPTDGTTARFIFATHEDDVGVLSSQSLSFHTYRTSGQATFPADAAPTTPSAPNTNAPGSSPDVPTDTAPNTNAPGSSPDVPTDAAPTTPSAPSTPSAPNTNAPGSSPDVPTDAAGRVEGGLILALFALAIALLISY